MTGISGLPPTPPPDPSGGSGRVGPTGDGPDASRLEELLRQARPSSDDSGVKSPQTPSTALGQEIQRSIVESVQRGESLTATRERVIGELARKSSGATPSPEMLRSIGEAFQRDPVLIKMFHRLYEAAIPRNSKG